MKLPVKELMVDLQEGDSPGLSQWKNFLASEWKEQLLKVTVEVLYDSQLDCVVQPVI